MNRVLLITNPVAARHDPSVLRTVGATFESLGVEVDIAGTTRHGDAARIAAEGVASGVDAIAVYGGDGTTMQAVSGMIGSGIPLGLIPGGTGNLLAGNLRLPRNPAKAARAMLEGARRPIDLGRTPRADGIHYGMVASGVGIDALIMEGATSALKRRFGMAAYVISTMGLISRIKPAHYRVTVDGQTLEADAITVVVANCKEVGPLFFHLGKEVRLDDGWLDVVVVTAGGPVSGVAAMWDLFRGGPKGSRILRAKGRRILVESDEVRLVQMDGELAGTTPFNMEVLPGALDVLVPLSVWRPAPGEKQEPAMCAPPAQFPGSGGKVHISARPVTEIT